MIYHLTDVLREQLNGQKHATVNRFKMFKNGGIQSKIITVAHNPKLHSDMKHHGIGKNKYENMHHYFQCAKNVRNKKISVKKLFSDDSYHISKVRSPDKPNLTFYKIAANKKQAALVRCSNNIIENIVFYDSNGKKIKMRIYDYRGFLSAEKFYDDSGESICSETYFTPRGKVAIEKTCETIDGEITPRQIRLYHRDKELCFDGSDGLITYYLTCILDSKNDIAIIDMNSVLNKPFNDMENQIRKIAVLHNRHTEGNDILKENIIPDYANIFNSLDKYNAIVTLTEKQKKDIAERFHNEKQIFVIPHALSAQQRERAVKINPNNAPKIISIARFDYQKRLEDTIKAFSKVVEKVPNAELHLFGFGPEVEKELRALIAELGLGNSAKVRGYTPDIHKEYITSKIKVVSSRYEGFHLGIMEAISYGIPVVSYDIKYGPSDMIETGVSGFLTAEDPNELAEKMIVLLKNNELYKTLSDNAYKKSFDFSEQEFIRKWKDLIRIVQNQSE